MTTALALPASALAVLDRIKVHAAALDQVIAVNPLDRPEDAGPAGELLRAIVTLKDEAEEERKAAKAPHLKAGRDVDDTFREPVASLVRVETMIRTRLAQAALKRAAEQREREEAIRKAKTPEETNLAILVASDPVFQTPVAGPGISERFSWEVESVDLSKVPVEFLALDLVKVRAAIAAANKAAKDPEIPGITFRRTAGVAVSRL